MEGIDPREQYKEGVSRDDVSVSNRKVDCVALMTNEMQES
jgi:hypothetical protein